MAYIDVDKFAEKICSFQAIDEDCANKMIWLLRTFPTADVVKVVRCKDCNYCEHCYPVKAIGGEAVEGWYCKIRKRRMRSDDFCSYGKRKEDK